ncbi:DUF4440 domain-containing protein [Roseateles cellulosilyticus]|uniref:Nuclear transport factor 2 family protein n=1 Tax=Pelomonas cellulosilytica TaxID=2906762 RepID=A0ABS8XNM6_9BURK|nr:DUF4440 domain-containing protein [Pelomonas sp. P8]MCE4553433.1 nuclear transport factor 2 family protein [Pelomonas sp. P8]
MSDLLTDLQRLESQLHHPGVRLDESRLQALLHAAFHEVGRSGSRYDRAGIVRFLAEQGRNVAYPEDVVADQFAVQALGPAAALLTYRTAHRQPDGTLARHTLRSSLWVNDGAGWQLLYHQGTPAGAPW